MAGKKGQKKRFWSDDEKRSICGQTTMAGVSVAQVARRYAMNANLIHNWLKDPRFAPETKFDPHTMSSVTLWYPSFVDQSRARSNQLRHRHQRSALMRDRTHVSRFCRKYFSGRILFLTQPLPNTKFVSYSSTTWQYPVRNLVCGTHQGQRSKPRKQAGHMTASDKCTNPIKYVLLCRSHPHKIFAAGAHLREGLQFRPKCAIGNRS